MAMQTAQYSSRLVKINGRGIGFELGFYPCAEHEWGIPAILKAFGVTFPVEGNSYESQRIKKLPEGLHFGNHGNDYYAIYDADVDESWSISEQGRVVYRPATKEERDKKINLLLERQFAMPERGTSLVTAWDRGSFGLRVRGEENSAVLNALEEAFLTNDVVIDRASSLTSRFGILIYSRIPEEVRSSYKKRS